MTDDINPPTNENVRAYLRRRCEEHITRGSGMAVSTLYIAAKTEEQIEALRAKANNGDAMACLALGKMGWCARHGDE